MILSIILSLFLLGGNSMTSVLDKVDSIIESNPDSAYVTLLELDRSSMSKKEAARFAVLYSMALDKKYIDVASDSVIRDAVNYYLHHGDADYRMRAFYYQGLVSQNAGDIDAAMDSYVRAEHYGRKSENQRMRGRVYMGLQNLHWSLFDIQNASVEAHKAAECFLSAGDTSRYINALIDECSCLNSLQEYEREELLIEELLLLQPLMNERQSNNFIAAHLIHDLDSGDVTLETIKGQVDRLSSVPAKLWLSIAYLYIKYDDMESAATALDNYESDVSADLSAPFYYFVKSGLCSKTGDFEDAFHLLDKYVSTKNSTDLRIMRSSATSANEEFEHQLAILKNRHQRTILMFFLLLAISAAYIVKIKLDQERNHSAELQRENKAFESEAILYSEQINHAKQEISQLKRLLSENVVSKDIRQQVDIRLDILNKYVAHQISETSTQDGYNDLKVLLANRKEFLNSMTASFAIAHPVFVKYLNDIGMTEREAGCCCLYCIGLRGNEIASYLEMSAQSYYNFSSKIRKKLGQKSYTSNINLILKEKLAEYDDGL